MCSIAGFISRKPLPHTAELCAALLYYGQPRGKQSSGIWTNAEGPGGYVYKRAMEPIAFIQDASFHQVAKPATMALVHTRQPTCGSRLDDGAQPFHGEKAVLVHNGVFTNHYKLRTDFELLNPSGVDSELAHSFVEKYGPKAMTRFMWQAFGSTALAFVYGKRMYLIRDGNPLEYCTITGAGNTFTVFASTEEQLLAAVRSIAYIQLGTKAESVPHRALCKVSATGVYHEKAYGPALAEYATKGKSTKVEDYSKHRGYGYGLGQQGIKVYESGYDSRDWPDRDKDVPPVNGNGHKCNESPTLPAASNGPSEAQKIVDGLVQEMEKEGYPE